MVDLARKLHIGKVGGPSELPIEEGGSEGSDVREGVVLSVLKVLQAESENLYSQISESWEMLQAGQAEHPHLMVLVKKYREAIAVLGRATEGMLYDELNHLRERAIAVLKMDSRQEIKAIK